MECRTTGHGCVRPHRPTDIHDDNNVHRRLSLRARQVQSQRARHAHGLAVQLFNLQQIRLPGDDRAKSAIRTDSRRGTSRRIQVQYRHGQASVLPALRHQVILRTAFPSRWNQCQCALPGFNFGEGHGHKEVRWPAMGKAVSDRTRRVVTGLTQYRIWPGAAVERTKEPGESIADKLRADRLRECPTPEH